MAVPGKRNSVRFMYTVYIRLSFIVLSIFLSFQIHRSEGSSAHRTLANLDQKDLVVLCQVTPNLTFLHLGWFQCPTTEECKSNLDKYLIAHIFNSSTVVVVDPEKFALNVTGALTILKVTPEYDNKTLLCIIKNPLIGSEEFSTLLEISKEPPKIISRSPQIVYVVKGMKLVLECYAVGYPLPQVTWMCDNKLLKNKTSTYANFERQTATMEDNGSYTCRAENSLGYDNHTMQVIVIDAESCLSSPPLEPPKIISKSLLTVYVVKDMKLVLECYAVGYPLPQVTWTRDNKLLKNETSTYANFERQTATMEDNGSYTCRAKNSLGYDNHTVRVIVIGKEDVESPIDCNKLLIVVIVLIVLLFGVLVIAFAVIFCLVQKNKKLDLLSKNSSDEQKDEDGSLELLPNPVVRKDLSQPVDSYLKSDVSLPVYLDATEL